MADRISSGEKKALVRLLRLVMRGAAVVTAVGGGEARLVGADGAVQVHVARAIDQAAALGLVRRAGDRLELADSARSFLRRAAAADEEEVFQAQHADLVTTVAEVEGVRQPVRFNRAESPLGPLSRLKDRDGGPFLPEEAFAAGERLAADFTRAQLQPRVTASWEPRLSSRSRGERGGMADLADSAIAARSAVNRAIEAMGPELSGVALDVCCFTKGLETVERERQWPARSAKLILRVALLALSRHYAPPARKPPSMRHWGTEDFRPDMS